MSLLLDVFINENYLTLSNNFVLYELASIPISGFLILKSSVVEWWLPIL